MDNFRKDKDLELINMSDVEVQEVRWLWYPYIPYGKVTIIHGDPGQGKTTFVLQLAAILSRGDNLPFSNQKSEPTDIIYQSAEDGLADTIKPRLEEANADCSKIHIIDESKSPLSMLDERIEKAIRVTGARVFILDPMQAYLGSRVDMHRANEVRPILKRLSNIAEKYNCAIILIGHMNKSSGSKSAYRLLGSVDFQASARSILIVGRVGDSKEKRGVAHEKSNLAIEGKTIGFELSEENGFLWTGYLDITVNELLSEYSRETKLQMAEKLLEENLRDGQIKSKDLFSKAQAIGVSPRTLEQAKTNMGVKSKRIGKSSYWYMP